MIRVPKKDPLRIYKAALKSETRRLPIGKQGKRYRAANRWSLTLTSPKEIRHILRENDARMKMRQECKLRIMELQKELGQFLVHQMPLKKEEKKVIDFEERYRDICPSKKTIPLEPLDGEKRVLILLPSLRSRIKSIRLGGESWKMVTEIVLREYTSNIQDKEQLEVRKLNILKEIEDVKGELSEKLKSANAELLPVFDTVKIDNEFLNEFWPDDYAKKNLEAKAELMKVVNSLKFEPWK